MSRRGEEEKNEEISLVFLLVRSGLTGFQLYSVLVSCLEDSWSSVGDVGRV